MSFHIFFRLKHIIDTIFLTFLNPNRKTYYEFINGKMLSNELRIVHEKYFYQRKEYEHSFNSIKYINMKKQRSIDDRKDLISLRKLIKIIFYNKVLEYFFCTNDIVI